MTISFETRKEAMGGGKEKFGKELEISEAHVT